MRTLVPGRPPWLFLPALLVAWAIQPATSPAASPTPAPSTAVGPAPVAELPAEPDQALQRGLELERARNWSAAIDVYEKALDRWPSRTDFSHRRRLCETHYRLVRRYQDQSFRNVLLKLPRERALALYDELVERIESHYVDPVPLEPLVRRGLDNLEVALRDPNFLRLNTAGEAAPERVQWLRDALRNRRGGLAVPDRAGAQGEVLAACELAKKALGIGEAAVILEFTYGACDALDDYTSYLTPDKLDDLYAMIDGNFVGLGIELKQDAEGLRLVGVIRGGPAWDAGLKPGDQITGVGGRSVKGLSLDEAAGKLQGAEGSPVEIAVHRGDGSTRTYHLVRRHVEVESVAGRIIDTAGGVGYVQLTGFQKSSTDELEKAIAGLRRKGMRSLVLDLRGNPGGLLNVAVEIAERFIESGVIVSTRGRAPGQSQVYRANARAVWKMPLTVLIDHDSASASEILAGALKDHHRAVIFGERSYGKGSVQSIFALRSVPAGLKLTTAKFYSPRSRPYSEQGVEPDVAVRVAAKPPGDGPSRPAEGAEDPALEQAVRHANGRANAAR